MENQQNNNKYYFTKQTEEAIVLYNNSSDPVFRDKIFREEIYYPLYKLAENIVHTFKFYYLDVEKIEDLKLDVISMLVEDKLHRFDPSNGAKAFSYFQTIVKRWLIQYNSKNYKKLKQVAVFEEVEDSYEEEEEQEYSDRTIKLSKIVDNFTRISYINMDFYFTKPQEQAVAEAILTIFKTRKDLDIFKKKALYIYIREMTECDTPVLTKVISKLKEIYQEEVRKYLNAGYTII